MTPAPVEPSTDDSVVGVTLDGRAPTNANAKDGTYTVTRQLFMNTDGTVKRSQKIGSNIGGGPTLTGGDHFGS